MSENPDMGRPNHFGLVRPEPPASQQKTIAGREPSQANLQKATFSLSATHAKCFLYEWVKETDQYEHASDEFHCNI